MVAVQTQIPETFEVRNPTTGELLKTLPVHSKEDVAKELRRVREAAARWAETPLPERARTLARVRQVVHRRADEIAELVSAENGKPRIEALSLDVGATLIAAHWLAENTERALSRETMHHAFTKHRGGYLSYSPKGVVSVIAPWNFPFFMASGTSLFALAAGNGVLLKPSELTPLSALLFKECLDQAGFDPDLLRVVTGFGATGAATIEAGPDHVVFTGSVATGKRVAAACGERLIPCTLELGGKAPAVVLEDADLERAANAITWGGLCNAGQICASVERVYAVEPIYDTLVDRVARNVERLKVGPAHEGVADIGSMAWERQRENVERLVADAKKKGARVVTGGERLELGKGIFYKPTILADCNHDMDVMRAEIFGPAIPFMRVRDEEEAIRLANDSHLGLGAYVFTGSNARGRRVAERIQAGSVAINDVVLYAGVPDIPWGGVKESGWGLVYGEQGLRQLSRTRYVSYGKLRELKSDPWWYPYDEKKVARLRGMLDKAFGDTALGKIVRSVLR